MSHSTEPTNPSPHGVTSSRRTLLKGAAWSVPVIAAAAAAPSAAASTALVITPGTPPALVGTCDTVDDFVFTVTRGGLPAAGQSVTVTLPPDFSWSDASIGPKPFLSDATGTVTVSGINAPPRPGNFSVIGQLASSSETTFVPVTVTGVWVGGKEGYGGTGVFSIYYNPSDTTSLGVPDDWAYCVEHSVTARSSVTGQVGDLSSFLGSNYFAGNVTVQDKVLWVLAHSYPALSLADFGTASGVPGISRNDAIEATQYAIWRYTDLTWDASWDWETDDSRDAYWYLVNGANAATGSGGTGSVVSIPTSDCGTPTPGDHAQSIILVTGA